MAVFSHFLFPTKWSESASNPKLLKGKKKRKRGRMETQFIGVQREMRRRGRSVGAIARSPAAYAEYNNIIFRFWESAADYEVSLETAGERRLSLAPTFCSEARSGCRPLGPPTRRPFTSHSVKMASYISGKSRAFGTAVKRRSVWLLFCADAPVFITLLQAH